MPRMTREEAVARIKELIREEGRINWHIGDLVLDQVPMGRDGVNNQSGEALTSLATEVGVDPGVLEERRFVSHRTPPTARAVGVSWSVYREIAYRPDEYERARLHRMLLEEAPPEGYKTWTVSLMREKVGRRPMLHVSEPLLPHVEAAPVEERVAAVTALLDDPEVRQHLNDTATPASQAFSRADAVRQNAILDRIGRLTRTEPPYDPVSKEMDAAQALTDLEEAMDAFVQRVVAAFPRITRMPDPETDVWARGTFMRQLVARSRGALDQIESLLNTGSPSGDIDHFMRDVLASRKEQG